MALEGSLEMHLGVFSFHSGFGEGYSGGFQQ